MTGPSSDPSALPSSSRIDQQSQLFESAWKSGSRPRIEDYLAAATADEAPLLLRRLVRLDVFHRRQRGEEPSLADYQDRFPRLDPHWLAEAIGDPPQRPPAPPPDPQQTPGLDGNESTRCVRRVSCPHCRCLLSVDTSRSDRFVCEECGNSFRLEAEETTIDVTSRSFGRFRLVERVGRGTFGTVWRAHDQELDRWVAIKLLNPGLLESGEYQKRLLREARTAARLRHPGIVKVHEAPTINDVPVLISDFINGVTLQELIKTQRLPFRESAELAADVADALACAHEAGLVHRDIKPGNIMLEFVGDADRRNGSEKRLRPVVVDFGLAIRPDDEVVMTLTGAVIGTPAYMSPEQAAGHGHRLDGRADIYSLGVVLYELLCGEMPFRGSKAMMIHQVLHEEPAAPRRLNDKIPIDLETICLKAMSKEPGRRFATARDMAADLHRFLRGEPIESRPVGSLERSWRWCRRNRAIASLIGAAVFLLLAGTTVASYFAVRMTRYATQAENLAARASQGEKNALGLARSLKEAKLRSDQNGYKSEIALATRDWHDGQAGLVLQRLETLAPHGSDQPDLRGFEWHYLKRLCRLDLATLTGHKERVLAVACSPDGKLIASGGSDGVICLWDVARQERIATLTGHAGPVRSLCFHPRGLELVSGGDDRIVRAWNIRQVLDTHAAQPPLELGTAGDEITCLAFSSDGGVLAAATARDIKNDGGYSKGKTLPGAVVFWDWHAQRPCFSPIKQPGAVWAIAFRPDNNQVALACQDQTIYVFALPSLLEVRRLKGHSFPVRCLAFSADGEWLASGDTHGEPIVWSAATGKEFVRFSANREPLSAVMFHPDGRRLISAGADRVLRFWDINTRSPVLGLPGHASAVRSIAISPFGGRRLVSASDDGTLKIWDTSVSEEAVTVQFPDGAYAVAFDCAGRLALAVHSRLHIVDPESGRTIRGWSLPRGNSAKGVAFTPEGSRLVSADCTGPVHVWDPLTGQKLLTICAKGTATRGVATSPDGTQMGCCGDEGFASLFDVNTGKELRPLHGHSGGVYSIAYDTDGGLVATAGGDGTVKIWDTTQGLELQSFTGHRKPVFAVAFQPRGPLIASGGMEATAFIWDSVTGKVVHKLEGHAYAVLAVCFSPDGRRLVTTDYKAARIWDVSTGAELLTLTGYKAPISGAAFSADGLRLATTSWDGDVRLWEAAEVTAGQLEWRDARSLVRFLRSSKLTQSELKKSIREDQTIAEPVRDKSLQLADDPG